MYILALSMREKKRGMRLWDLACEQENINVY